MGYELKSWLTGYTLGLTGKPLPLPQKEPVAYDYNGTLVSSVYPDPWELEIDLPENMATEYPYKLYLWYWGPGYPFPFEETYMFNEPVFVDGDNIVSKDGKKVDWLMYEAMPAGYRNDWTFVHHQIGWYKLTSLENDTIKWANFDIYNIDGSLYLEGTDAIPVYE